MKRRQLVRSTAGGLAALSLAPPLAGLLPHRLFGGDGSAASSQAWAAEGEAFDRSVVLERARALAQQDFAWPEPPLTDQLKNLGYSDYQGIRFRSPEAIWTDAHGRFSIDLFHSGFIFNVPVEIFSVEDGQARKIVYSPELFTFQDMTPPSADDPMEFAGFRARTPLNDPEVMDEFLVFAGASYFRAIGRGQNYGLSARGLAISTAEPEGEEFPFFRSFWLERPDSDVLVVHALLDSPSCSGAYRFSIRPGDNTVMDVEATLFTRKEIQRVGLAPLTSMYLYSPKDGRPLDDFRPAIHDSDGLSIWNGRGEWIWRPLNNPRELQISAFLDTSPRGFGLMQRERRFSEHEDLEALYHKRPSLWIEPIGDWQNGAVVLIEIPTAEEIHDNIVCFWRPSGTWKAAGEYTLTYRMYWGEQINERMARMRVINTLTGRGTQENWRRYIIDFAPPADAAPLEGEITVAAHATHGTLFNVIAHPNPEIGGTRVNVEYEPGDTPTAELRVDLLADGEPVGETWIYRWTS